MRRRPAARWLASAPNDVAADIICARLAEGGVHPRLVGSDPHTTVVLGPRDIYVDEEELDRALEILRAAEDVDDSHLMEPDEREADRPVDGSDA